MHSAHRDRLQGWQISCRHLRSGSDISVQATPEQERLAGQPSAGLIVRINSLNYIRMQLPALSDIITSRSAVPCNILTTTYTGENRINPSWEALPACVPVRHIGWPFKLLGQQPASAVESLQVGQPGGRVVNVGGEPV